MRKLDQLLKDDLGNEERRNDVRLIDVIDRIYEGKEVFLHFVRNVADLMTVNVKTLTMDHKLSYAVAFLRENGFRHIPITEEDTATKTKKLVGIVSDRDLLRVLSAGVGTLGETDADQKVLNKALLTIMTRPVITATPTTSIFEAIRTMLQEKVDCLPVIDKESQVVGILTTIDVMKCILRMEVLRKARETKGKSARLIDFARHTERTQPTEFLFESLLSRVSDVMQEQVYTVTLDQTIQRVVDLMQEHEFRHVVVTDKDGAPKGIISDRDVLRHLPPREKVNPNRPQGLQVKFREDLFRINDNDKEAKRFLGEKVSTIMSANPACLPPDATLVQLAELLCNKRFGACLITNPQDGSILGITTQTDLLGAFVALGRVLGSSRGL